MSGKSEKKLRKVVHDEYYLKAKQLEKQAVESWITNLLTSPFRKRFSVAMKIIKGVRKHV